MEFARLAVLSDEDIREIHKATVAILTNCGVKLLHLPMLQFLKQQELAVDGARQGP
jgi:trimethylamine:corrinoid methyltransferase-like protein